ncbi:alginate lyase family protein [Helicobacter felis]|uniref:Alginate lyase (Precursor) n=1 Tax=Helicobacter felis (strain ATCC 49179 / CCUG 28539 / NCTC 12436 / CS1) TaxID=936155 RepID=E7AAX1_HELFC|nr:alginate lyase family protein [Helicobacter felis]CBY83583.1 alginate lyase (EC 4.2.2.3) (Precursor) [Helicobacter felis ATCC 49179]
MQKLILLGLCFLSVLQATPYFFRNFHSAHLERAIHLHRKLQKEIQTCAQLNTLPHYTPTGERKADFCSAAFKRSATLSYDLALGFLVSGKDAYAQRAQEILEQWAQHLKLVSSKEAKNLINFYMPYMNMAYLFIRSRFASPLFEQFSSNMLAYARYNKDNNIGAWAILLGVSSALVANDHDLLLKMSHKWQKWILDAIDGEGVMAKEIVRSNTANYNSGPTKGIKGIAYTHFALTPISIAGQLLAENGFDLWHSHAAQKLFKAYDKSAQWVLDPKSFPYYQPNLIGLHHDAYFLLLNQYYKSTAGQQAIKQGDFKGDRFRLQFNDDLRLAE